MTGNERHIPVELEFDATFRPCPVEPNDELYPNGLFVFNITRLLAYVDAHADRFPIEHIPLDELPDYGDGSPTEASVRSADLSRPILLAEISPGLYNVIDGHHRLARARREGARTLQARRIPCLHHIPFLTSTAAYETYVAYWNDKRGRARAKGS